MNVVKFDERYGVKIIAGEIIKKLHQVILFVGGELHSIVDALEINVIFVS